MTADDPMSQKMRATGDAHQSIGRPAKRAYKLAKGSITYAIKKHPPMQKRPV
jgi:hypothetical protein